MKNRIFISVLWIIFLWATIFLLPGWIFALTVTIIIAIAMYEFFDMIGRKNLPAYKYFAIIVGCLIPFVTYLEFEPTQGWEFLLITAVCLSVFLLQFTKRKTDNAISGVAIALFAIFYVSWFFSFIIKIRFSDLIEADGRMMVAFLLLVAKSGDIGAYFFGKYLGRHHLIPRISPKKSTEGAIGGFVTSLVVALLFSGLMQQINFFHIIILGALLGIVGQIGDLSESLIKRDCRVKDSGVLFFGLGGMLDLIDSLLFTTPIFYFYIRFLS